MRQPEKRRVDPAVISRPEDRPVDDMALFDERGIECGDGWVNLIDRLSGACESISTR